jgi:hypothetical protein
MNHLFRRIGSCFNVFTDWNDCVWLCSTFDSGTATCLCLRLRRASTPHSSFCTHPGLPALLIMAGTPPNPLHVSLEARRGGTTSRSQSRTGRSAAVNTSQAPPESSMSVRGRGVSVPSQTTASHNPPRGRGNTHSGRTYHLSDIGGGSRLATAPECAAPFSNVNVF